jgi:hypothetical protein
MKERSMGWDDRAWPGRFVLAGSLGTVLLLSACGHAATGVAPGAAGRRAPGPSAIDDEPLGLVREPGVTLLRGAAPTPPAVWAPVPAADATTGVLVDAALGGVIRTGDGLAEATIPPGALDRTAVVVLQRYGTDALPVAAGVVPTMRFRLDLGGARVVPGAAIPVTTVLDPATAARLEAGVPAERLAELGLSRDGSGRLAMTMPVHGPAPASVAAPSPDKAAAYAEWMTQEFGALPMPPVPGEPDRGLMQLQKTYNGPALHIPAKAPSSTSEFKQIEWAGLFSCNVGNAPCLFNALWDMDVNKKAFTPEVCGVYFDGPPTPAPTATPRPAPVGGPVGGQPAPVPVVVAPTGPAAIPARVTWESDDPALDGRPVPGAVVRFRLPTSLATGPNEIVADAGGAAGTFAPAGTAVHPQAMSPDGVFSGPAADAVVAPGMPRIELKLPCMMPVVILKVEDTRPLPKSLALRYHLAGFPDRDLRFEVKSEDPFAAVMDFRIELPQGTTKGIPFAITTVDLGDGRLPVEVTAPFPVTWNGVYPARVIFGDAPPPK